MKVSDDGVGLPADFSVASASTLGVELVNTLTRQLRGTLSARTGDRTEFEVRFRVAKQAPNRAAKVT